MRLMRLNRSSARTSLLSLSSEWLCETRERFGVLQDVEALRGPGDARKRRMAGALHDAGAGFEGVFILAGRFADGCELPE